MPKFKPIPGETPITDIKAADDHDYQPLLALHQRFTSAKSSEDK